MTLAQPTHPIWVPQTPCDTCRWAFLRPPPACSPSSLHLYAAPHPYILKDLSFSLPIQTLMERVLEGQAMRGFLTLTLMLVMQPYANHSASWVLCSSPVPQQPLPQPHQKGCLWERRWGMWKALERCLALVRGPLLLKGQAHVTCNPACFSKHTPPMPLPQSSWPGLLAETRQGAVCGWRHQ